jgi:SAM-dependent methyltransferase
MNQIETQRLYYRSRRPLTMQPRESSYARRHFQEMVRAAELQPGERVLELGAGMGRFSRLLAQRPGGVTAVELSPELAAICAQTLAPHPESKVLVADATTNLPAMPGGFDLVAGFFFLHHLERLEECLAQVRSVLRPGGRFCFVEPNPFNPLYYLQIALSPTMLWSVERGIVNMREGILRPISTRLEFRQLQMRRYGALPRILYDPLARISCACVAEALVPAVVRPFVIFTGRTYLASGKA